MSTNKSYPAASCKLLHKPLITPLPLYHASIIGSLSCSKATFSNPWSIYDLKESLALWLLALMGAFVVGSPPVFGFDPCLTLAKAYTIPLTKPTAIAETLGIVTGASKNMRPLKAIGSLLRAPTIE